MYACMTSSESQYFLTCMVLFHIGSFHAFFGQVCAHPFKMSFEYQSIKDAATVKNQHVSTQCHPYMYDAGRAEMAIAFVLMPLHVEKAKNCEHEIHQMPAGINYD
jgi:hypothetical protein